MDRKFNSPQFFHSLFLLLSICLSWSCAQHTVQEAFDALGISWNPDGTLNRTISIPMVGPTPSANTNPPPIALSTDIFFTSDKKSHVRVYIPVNPPTKKKLPLIIYIHGGDFVLFSSSTVVFHNFCNNIAAQFPAVVVSVEYRLAPEHRLPAAYDDALNAIFWARNQSLRIGGRHPWMEYARFSRVFLLGSSAGANAVYHVALRAMDYNIWPLKIRGILLNQPFFGGVKRTKSETQLAEDKYVPPYITDVLWTLALPINATRDHEFCNPISGGTYMGWVFRLPKVYIKGDYGDPLISRSVKLARFLSSCRVLVYYRFNKGGFHGIDLQNATAAQQLYDDMKYFVNHSTARNKKYIIPSYIDMTKV